MAKFTKSKLAIWSAFIIACLCLYWLRPPIIDTYLYSKDIEANRRIRRPLEVDADVSKIKDGNFFHPFLFILSDQKHVTLFSSAGQRMCSWDAKNLPGFWHDANLISPNELIAVSKSNYVAAFDQQGKRQWLLNGRYHHRTALSLDGDILAFRRQLRKIKRNGQELAILVDYLDFIGRDGRLKSSIDLFEVLGTLVSPSQWQSIQNSPRNAKLLQGLAQRSDAWGRFSQGKGDLPEDVFHSNSINVNRGNGEHLFIKGDIVLTLRNMNKVVVLDKTAKRIKWHSENLQLEWPHGGKVTSDEKILVFDNGPIRGYSRILKIDPLNHEIIDEVDRFPNRVLKKRGGFTAESPVGDYYLSNTRERPFHFVAASKDKGVGSKLKIKISSPTAGNGFSAELRWLDELDFSNATDLERYSCF